MLQLLEERPAALAGNRQRVETHLSVLEDRAKFLPAADKTLVCLYLRGELRNRQDEALRYALSLNLLDAFTIGAESIAEQQDLIRRIAAA